MNEPAETVILYAAVIAVAVVALVGVWRQHRRAFWAAVGVPAGIAWCCCTYAASWFTAWQPDLGPVPHGSGYLIGAGVAVLVFAGTLVG